MIKFRFVWFWGKIFGYLDCHKERFELFLIAGTIIMGVLVYRETKNQVQEMRDALNFQKNIISADINFEILGTRDTSYKSGYVQEEWLKLRLSNDGQSPARNVNYSNVVVVPARGAMDFTMEEIAQCRLNKPPFKYTLGSKSTMEIEMLNYSEVIESAKFGDTNNAQFDVMFCGIITYSDVVGEAHEITFCGLYNANRKPVFIGECNTRK